jgi:hypothetical protein
MMMPFCANKSILDAIFIQIPGRAYLCPWPPLHSPETPCMHRPIKNQELAAQPTAEQLQADSLNVL